MSDSRNRYRAFQTSSGTQYVYLTGTNQILTLEESLCEEELEQALMEAGFLDIPEPEAVIWPNSWEEYQEKVDGDIPSMTLELTQQCSLRCTYCVYSGNYEGIRTHQPCSMSQETLRRSIDFFLYHNRKHKDAHIVFYGGEALLEFDKLCFAVAYAREKNAGKKPLTFSISTNGTTMTDRVLRWLAENEDVTANVTINGDTHDQYRKFPNGEGSLAVILKMVQKVRGQYPQVWDRLNFIANIASVGELLDLRRFYMEQVGKPPAMITAIAEEGGNDVIREILNVPAAEEATLSLLRKLYYRDGDAYIQPYFHFHILHLAGRKVEPLERNRVSESCCMPFLTQVFVAADGTLGMCEKVGQDDRLGSVETGICLEGAQTLLTAAQQAFTEKCSTCWAQRLCGICYQDMKKSCDGMTISDSFCSRTRDGIARDLELYCEMAEQEPGLVEALQQEVLEKSNRFFDPDC